MRAMLLLPFLLSTTVAIAQDEALRFSPADSLESVHGWTPLRFSTLPDEANWPRAGASGRGVFGLHTYAVPGSGPTRDRANEAVVIGWNPMGRLLPLQPGFWWQYEWGYNQDDAPLFELNLDVRDSTFLGIQRRISYKMNRNTGTGISADFAFNFISFSDGGPSAGGTLEGGWLQIAAGADRLRSNLRTEFRKIVQYTVHKHIGDGTTLRLPLERGVMYSARLIDSTTARSDSTHIILNSMESGTIYTVKLRNERPRPVRLTWSCTLGRNVFWDARDDAPTTIDRGETLVFTIVMDEERHAFAKVYGTFREP